MDTLRWHEKRMSWWYVVPDGIQDMEDKRISQVGDYHRYDTLDEHVAVVKDYMSRKLKFLDELWIEQRDYCVVEVRNPAPFLNQGINQTLYYWVEKGTALDQLPNYEDPDYVFEGYYDIDTGEEIENGSIIEEDCIIEGIWNEKVGE